MWNVLISLAKRAGCAVVAFSIGTLSLAQQVPVAKEGTYADLVAAPENGPLVDAVLEAWLDGAGFEALRTHLEARSTQANLTVNEHAALGFLWRRLYQPVTALDHWKKATELEPEQIPLWMERAGQELRLNRLPEALTSLGKITLPDDPQQVRTLVRSLAPVVRQTSDQSAQLLLHQWMTSRPDDVALWLELVDFHGRFSGSGKQWLERLAGWRETVEDPALLTKIRLLECDELTNQSKRQEAFETLIAGLGAVTVDSNEEAALLPSLVNLLRQSANENPPLKPNLEAFARTQMERPAVVMALAREFNEQGEISQALNLLKALAEALPADPRIPAARLLILEESGRRDEALTLLRSGPDKIGLALALKDEGLADEALEALSDLPDGPLAQALRGLIEGKEPAFPEEPKPPAPVAPAPATQRIEIGGPQFEERLRDLFERWQAVPTDPEIASELLLGWSATGKRAEADHLFKQTLKQMESVEEKIAWVKELHRSERGRPMRFDFRRALLTAGQVQQDNADFWLLMAEAVGNQGSDFRAEVLGQAADRLSGEQALAVRLQAAEIAFESQRFPQVIAMANELLGSSQDAGTRLLLTRLDLREGRVDQARRTAWGLAEHPAMTPTRALGIAAELIRWGEAAEAAAFVALQRQRFPQDGALRMFQLKSALQAGLSEVSIEWLLKIGSIPEPSVPGSQQLGPTWRTLQAAIAIIDAQDSGGLRPDAIGNRAIPASNFVIDRGFGVGLSYFAMAHLLRHAERTGLDLAERRALAERAEAAGLPFPFSLIWARMDTNEHGQATLALDLDQVEKLPVEQWAEAVTFHYQQRLLAQPFDTKVLTEQDNRLLKTLTTSLLAKQPVQALQLSFRWWHLRPDVAESETALRTVLASSEPTFEHLLFAFQPLQIGLSPEQKKHPLMKEVAAVLLTRLEALDKASESYGRWIFQVADYLFQLDQWQQAADLTERGWPLQSGPTNRVTTQVPPEDNPPPWIFWQSQSPLAWPPQVELLGLTNAPTFLIPQRLPSSNPRVLPQEQRAAFLAAGAKLTHQPFRLLWLLVGGDEEGAKTLIREWQKETPDSSIATQLAATVAASEGKLEDALDMLHRLIARHADKSEEQRHQQVDYLRAALVPLIADSSTRESQRPPPDIHRERVQQILRELQPELEAWPAYASAWVPVFKAAGMEQATAGWKQLNQASHQTEEVSNRAILTTRSNSRLQRQIERAFAQRHVGSYEVTRLLETGFRPQAVALLLRALKAEADQIFLRSENSRSEWFDLLQQRPDLREVVLNAARALRRHRPRELNQAIHLATACEAWQELVEWASESSAIADANPSLKSRVDLARLEMGMGVAELAKELSATPTRIQSERFRGLMSPIHNPRSLERQLRLAELFVTLAEQSPPLPPVGANEASGLVSTVLQALSRSYSLPNNAGVIPPLYPELESNPPEHARQTQPNTITEADSQKRRDLHARLCDLAFSHPTWFQAALPHIVQRHLVENQPTLDALVERINQSRNDLHRSSHFNLDRLARLGHSWRDVSLRLRLADLLKRVLAAPAEKPPSAATSTRRQPDQIESLITLIGGEVKGEADPPLWALWEYPRNVTAKERAYTAEQKAWNKERNEVFTELATWALDQPAYLASMVPRWANYRLFFPDTNDEVLAQIRRLRDRPDDPFVLKAFVQAAQLAYDNEHHIRAGEVAVTLLKEMAPEQRDPSIASQLFQLLSHGRSNQAQTMPSLELAPEAIVPATHRLTADLQRRRLALVEDLGDGMELSALPPALLLWRLTKAVKDNVDTKAIEDALIAIGKANPEQLNAPLKEYVERLDPTSNIELIIRLHRALLQIGEGYVEQAVANKQSPQWLERIAKPILPREDYHIDPLPHPSGQLNDPDPYHQVPNAWADLAPEITEQRRENFLRALAVCARDPKLRLQTLGERLVNDLTNREKWPELFDLLEEETKKDFYSEGALNQWLQWERSYFNLERVSAATEFLIQCSDRLDTLVPQSSHYWLRHALTLYVRHPSKGLDPREYVSLAPPDSPLHASRPIGFDEKVEHRESAKKLRTEWLRLIEHAASKPAALPEVFNQLTQAYLESDPQRLVSLAQKLPEKELTEALQPLLERVRQSHSHIPLRFRLTLAEFVLLFPGVAEGSKPAPNQPAPPTIPLDVLSLSLNVSVLPYNSLSPTLLAQLQDPSLLSRRQALLDQIDQLAARDERLVAAQRVTQLLESLAQRPPTAAEIEQTLDHARAQPAGVLLAFDSVSEPNNVIPSQITEDQRLADLNQAELMISVIERWPGTLDYKTSQWFYKLMTLLGPYSNTNAEHFSRIASLQERLMDVASADQALTNRAFYAYADACCLTQEGTKRLIRRVTALLEKSPIAANSALAVWLSNSHPVSTRPIDAELRGLTLCRDLVRDWPEPTTPETLSWPRSVVKWSQHGDLALRNSRIGSQQQAISPTPPSNPASRALIGEILDLMQKRPAGAADWVVPARLRHNARLGLTPAALADVIEPLFQPELKDKTLAYFTQVFESRSSPWPFFRHPALQGEVILEPMEELRDILRSLAAVAHGQWLPETDLDRLIAQIRSAESRFLTAVGTSLKPQLEVRGLAEEYKTLAAQRFRKSPLVLLLPADVPAYIQSSLIQEAALPEVVERVWQTLENAPAMGSAALKTWAETINKDTYYHAYRDAGKLVSRLLERWKADWPAPDWAVVFLRNWRLHGWKAPGIATSTLSAEDRAFGQLRAELRPQLQTQLMAFPSCSEEDYFALVVATPYGLPVPTEPKVIALAEAVVKNRLGSGRLPALLPEQAPVSTSYSASGKRSSPLSSPLWSPTETWVLLEHSLRNGRTPAIDALFDAEVWRPDDQSTPLFESLKGLFLDPAEAFVAHAANFRTAAATAKMKHDPFLWVLRIALLRELPLTWQDLRVMAPPSAAGTALGMLAVPQDSALQYWVHYLHERGEHSFVEDLVGYCRDIAAESLFELASAAPVNVGPTIVHLRAIPVPQKPFLSPEWNRVWESLITAAQVAATWPSVVTAAERLGFLENPKLADCFAAVRSNDSWTYQEPAAWLASLQPTGLSSDDAAIAPLWFSLDDRPAWIWQLASLLDDDAKPAAMAELARLHRSQPALGRALLRLALLASHSTLSPAQLTQELAPVLSQLNAQAEPLRLAITRSLHAQSPRLSESIAAAPANSLLRALSLAATEEAPATEVAFWLADAAATEDSASADQVFLTNKLGDDLRRLVLSDHSQSSEVFLQGLDRLLQLASPTERTPETRSKLALDVLSRLVSNQPSGATSSQTPLPLKTTYRNRIRLVGFGTAHLPEEAVYLGLPGSQLESGLYLKFVCLKLPQQHQLDGRAIAHEMLYLANAQRPEGVLASFPHFRDLMLQLPPGETQQFLDTLREFAGQDQARLTLLWGFEQTLALLRGPTAEEIPWPSYLTERVQDPACPPLIRFWLAQAAPQRVAQIAPEALFTAAQDCLSSEKASTARLYLAKLDLRPIGNLPLSTTAAQALDRFVTSFSQFVTQHSNDPTLRTTPEKAAVLDAQVFQPLLQKLTDPTHAPRRAALIESLAEAGLLPLKLVKQEWEAGTDPARFHLRLPSKLGLSTQLPIINDLPAISANAVTRLQGLANSSSPLPLRSLQHLLLAGPDSPSEPPPPHLAHAQRLAGWKPSFAADPELARDVLWHLSRSDWFTEAALPLLEELKALRDFHSDHQHLSYPSDRFVADLSLLCYQALLNWREQRDASAWLRVLERRVMGSTRFAETHLPKYLAHILRTASPSEWAKEVPLLVEILQSRFSGTLHPMVAHTFATVASGFSKDPAMEQLYDLLAKIDSPPRQLPQPDATRVLLQALANRTDLPLSLRLRALLPPKPFALTQPNPLDGLLIAQSAGLIDSADLAGQMDDFEVSAIVPHVYSLARWLQLTGQNEAALRLITRALAEIPASDLDDPLDWAYVAELCHHAQQPDLLQGALERAVPRDTGPQPALLYHLTARLKNP